MVKHYHLVLGADNQFNSKGIQFWKIVITVTFLTPFVRNNFKKWASAEVNQFLRTVKPMVFRLFLAFIGSAGKLNALIEIASDRMLGKKG